PATKWAAKLHWPCFLKYMQPLLRMTHLFLVLTYRSIVMPLIWMPSNSFMPSTSCCKYSSLFWPVFNFSTKSWALPKLTRPAISSPSF
ncbi:hypothetical protein C0989_010880, partial [Termitomyces sp. Mn162]